MKIADPYGIDFPSDYDEAQIEREYIRHGGYIEISGKKCGRGLVHHFKRYWSLLWPDDSQTWWTDLILKEVLQNQFTALVGPASGWKSGSVARIALMDWSCFSDCTSVMMSSTHMEGLKARIYGEITQLWKLAKESFDWFPGHPIDSRCVITNESVEEDLARDIRNSIVGIPCQTSTGRFVGMGRYQGRKNRRVWCIADEFQFMQLSILDAQDNLISNGPNLVPGFIPETAEIERGKPLRGYKCVFIGNTNPSVPGNPLDIVCEPEHGFNSIPENGKTKVWSCKQVPNHPVKCRCLNLDALDSPNNEFPIEKPRWLNLAGKHMLVKYQEGSESYYSQGRGIFKFGLAAFKIITREVCDQFHAFDSLIWEGSEITKIGMCDAAYGGVGGDRCPLGWLEFGKCLDGVTRILLHPFWLVPIVASNQMIPEDQIALFTKEKMESVGVQPENFFFDGRGSLAMSYARIWSPQVNAIEFGGRSSKRPVDNETYILDKETNQKRLKLCDEHYSKFVSELWWSWRRVVESDQMRGLSLEIVLDGQPREWCKVSGDRIEIETKKDMKKRTGFSPDLADMVVTGIEGARRRGFTIGKLGKIAPQNSIDGWLRDKAKAGDKWNREKQLVHA